MGLIQSSSCCDNVVQAQQRPSVSINEEPLGRKRFARSAVDQ